MCVCVCGEGFELLKLNFLYFGLGRHLLFKGLVKRQAFQG